MKILVGLIVVVLAVLLVRHVRKSKSPDYDYEGELPRNPRDEGGPRNPLP